MVVEREVELDLVARLREGDADAFDVVYDAYRARLYSFLLRLSRRRDVSEDLLEETWLRLVTHRDRLKPDTRLGPWLFTVARNLYWSYLRSRHLEEAHAAQLIGLWPTAPSRPSPFDVAAGDELEARVWKALASMPVAYREVLLLVGAEGLTPGEAAEVCGVKPEALRKRLSRARAMLSAALDATPHRAGPFVEVTT